MNLAGESVQEGGPFPPVKPQNYPVNVNTCAIITCLLSCQSSLMFEMPNKLFFFPFLSHMTVTETHYRLGLNKMLPWFLNAEDVKRVLAGFLLEIVQ